VLCIAAVTVVYCTLGSNHCNGVTELTKCEWKLEVVDQNNFAAEFYHFKVEYHIFCVFVTFSTPK